MKKVLTVVLFFLITSFATLAHADLEGFLRDLDTKARTDIKGFNAKLSSQFGVPVPDVEKILKMVANPADAFMVLQLGQMSGKRPDVVVQTYKTHRSQGWGVMAKELGIKPGSPEFHALKRGDLALTGAPSGAGSDSGKGKGKGKGRGRGHNKED